MEIDITDFFNTECPRDYSASIAELGPFAARDTWSAANDNAPDWAAFLDTEEKRDAFKRHMRDMGFSEAEEFATWTHDQMTALFIQCISADMRDYRTDVTEWDWTEYEKGCEQGRYSGRIYRGDDGCIYYYLGA